MSFNLLDAKWGTTVYGTPSGEVTWAADVDDGITTAGGFTTADYEAAVQAAFDAWEGAASVNFTEISNIGAADITLDMGALAGNVIGEASITTSVTGGPVDQLIDVDILLDSTETWTPFGTGGNTSFFAVATHEIGHAIGLDHVNDTSEIMNDFISTNELGDGDVRGAQLIYGRDAGDLNAADLADDGGGGGGGVAGLILGLLGLLAALFGVGGGAAAPLILAAEDHDDDHDDHDDHDHFEDLEGEDLIAFLDHALRVETHSLYIGEVDDAHDHDDDHENEVLI